MALRLHRSRINNGIFCTGSIQFIIKHPNENAKKFANENFF